jgi:hypothetical protein
VLDRPGGLARERSADGDLSLSSQLSHSSLVSQL